MLARACIECIIGYLGDGGLVDLWWVCDAVASPRPTAPLAASTPPVLFSLLEVVDSSFYCLSCHRAVIAMTAMVIMPGVPDSGDAYTMNAIAVDVPMATLAVTAGVVAISNFIS